MAMTNAATTGSVLTADILDEMRKAMAEFTPLGQTMRRGFGYSGLPITSSPAVPPPTEKTVRSVMIEEFTWRGRKDYRTRIIERTVIEETIYTLRTKNIIGGYQTAFMANPAIVERIRKRLSAEFGRSFEQEVRDVLFGRVTNEH